MKTSLTRTGTLLFAASALALSGLILGCTEKPASTTATAGQFVDDSAITAKVKGALLADDNVKSLAIGVETVKGVVQLSGFVTNADQKSAAGKVAAGVAGVQSVSNNLIVK